MNKFTNPLENIRIASPCKADWNEMIGSERQRFCGECKLNVYNLSGMTREEAENLLIQTEGRLCVRFYKRADGSVLTKDCPVGWQAVKRRVSKMAAASASLLFGLFGSLGLMTLFNQPDGERLMGKIQIENSNISTLGAVTVEETPIPIMGNIAIPTPTPKSEPEEFTMGKIAIPAPEVKPKSQNLKTTIRKVMSNKQRP